MSLRNIKNNKLIITIVTMVLSIVIFAGSYFTSFFYNTYKENKEHASSVMNEKKENEEILKDDMNIVFTRKTPDENVFIDYKTTIKDYKNQINIEELTIDLLEKELSKKGYEKVSYNEREVIFNRDQQGGNTTLEANKYYIGEKDGYIAIFKSDENGVVNIESQEDITGIRLEDLSDRDKETIKNFNKKFDTREECEEELSAYTS